MLLHLEDLESGNSNGGRIWLTVGDRAFPEEGWYDLPGILLEAWMPGLDSFFANHTDSCELRFLDGPYLVRLRRSGERITALCMEGSRVAIEEIGIDVAAFQESVRRAARYYKRTKCLVSK